MKVRYIKMKNGEEMIAEIVSETIDDEYCQTAITVRNPVIAQVYADNNGTPKLQFLPWAGFSKQREIEIPSSDILFTSEVEDAVERAYTQAFSSVIIPDSGIRNAEGDINNPQLITG